MSTMSRYTFVMEQTLGHVTYHQNLARRLERSADVSATWVPIALDQTDLWDRVPVVRSNWSLKASLRARDALRGVLRSKQVDALFLHTQTVALFAVPFMRRIPTLISLDATPLNYDAVGAEYGHGSRLRWLERRKYLWNRATFHEAAALVTWCRWAKQSLVDDYGVPADRVTVIPPGVDTELWRPAQGGRDRSKLRILFTGGDFHRKGGDLLLRWARETLLRDWELHVVTRCGVPDLPPGVVVHTGISSNDPALVRLAQLCDLFALPTRADCFSIAAVEAMAAGLPVVATNVGGIPEIVTHGKNGYLTKPDDYEDFRDRLEQLMQSSELRRDMGRSARAAACELFDVRDMTARILHLMRAMIHPRTAAAQQSDRPLLWEDTRRTT